MIDERLKAYIQYELRKGHPREAIRKALLDAGHQLEKIEEHFKSIEEEYAKKPNALLILLIFFIILSVILSFTSIFLYTKQNSSQKYTELVSESKDLCGMGEYDKAFKILQKAMEYDEKNAYSRAFGVMGYCYIQQKKFYEAIIALREVVLRNSQEPAYFYGLGLAYCNLNSFNLGIANLKRSIYLNPSNPDSYKILAECYSKSGDNESAREYFELFERANLENISSG